MKIPAALGCVLAAAGLAGAGPAFKEHLTVPTTQSPWDVGVGDFNGDGRPDFVVAGGYKQLAVHRSNGKGGLAKAGYLSTGTSETKLCVADMDGDKHLDIVTCDKTVLRIRYGDGEGRFLKKEARLPCGKGPERPVAADLNGDGKLDLVVPCANGKITVLTAKPEKGYKKKHYKVGKAPVASRVADMNGDGKLDIVTITGRGMKMVVLLADEKKGFVRHSKKGVGIGMFSTDLVLGDFNGDRKLDAAMTNLANKGVVIHFGDGKGGFTSAGRVSTGPHPKSLARGDIDGDGDLDLAVCDHKDGSVTILMGDGKGSFSVAAKFEVGLDANGVALADVDGDKKLDVIVVASDSPEDKLVVYRQQ